MAEREPERQGSSEPNEIIIARRTTTYVDPGGPADATPPADAGGRPIDDLLEGVDYPAVPIDVARVMHANGASERTLENVRAMPSDMSFQSRREFVDEYRERFEGA